MSQDLAFDARLIHARTFTKPAQQAMIGRPKMENYKG